MTLLDISPSPYYPCADTRVAPEQSDFLTGLCRPTNSGQQLQEVVMQKIELTQGKFALVDDADYELLSRFKWYAHKQPHTWYARRDFEARGRHFHVYMHREIMGRNGPPVDHLNGNGLDNRRSNIRHATQSQNMQRARSKRGVSGFRGVDRMATKNERWTARIPTKNNTRRYLGTFESREAAARAYDREVVKLYGCHAATNFPIEEYATT